MRLFTVIKHVSITAVGVMMFAITALADLPTTEPTAILTARLEAVQSVTAKYDRTIKYTPLEQLLKTEAFVEGFQLTMLTGDWSTKEELRFLSGWWYHTERLVGKRADDVLAGRDGDPLFTVESSQGDRFEQLTNWPRGHVPNVGSISPPNTLLADGIVAEAVGLVFPEHGIWITPKVLAGAEVAEKGNEIVCSASNSNGVRHELTFDTTKGCALVTLKCFVDDKLCYQCDNSDFRLVGGLMLPFVIHGCNYAYDKATGKKQTVREQSVTVTSWSINDENNTRQSYKMIWPKGTALLDARTGKRLTIASATRSVDDAAITAALQKREDEMRKSVEDAQQRINRVLTTRPSQPATNPGQ